MRIIECAAHAEPPTFGAEAVAPVRSEQRCHDAQSNRRICARQLWRSRVQPPSAQTLNTVKTRGILNCGANVGLAGFGIPDSQGKWTGFDVDFCRAVAAAIFNDPTKVKFVPTTGQNRFTALQSGEVDLLARKTTWTSSRDTSLGLNFTGINYYDGQGFIVRKALKVKSALERSFNDQIY